MTIDEKRYLVASCYGDSWKEKVGRMSDNQIDALYYTFTRKGKIEDEVRLEYAEIQRNKNKPHRSSYIPPSYEELLSSGRVKLS